MKKIVFFILMVSYQVQAETIDENIFEFSESFREAIIHQDKDFLKELDRSGNVFAPWVVNAVFDDASAEKLLGAGKRSVRSIMSEQKLMIFVSKVQSDLSSSETYDVYFAVPSEDKKVEISHRKLGESLLVCRFVKKENYWVLPSHFCYFETGGPFE